MTEPTSPASRIEPASSQLGTEAKMPPGKREGPRRKVRAVGSQADSSESDETDDSEKHKLDTMA
jgi:hypothetical protein